MEVVRAQAGEGLPPAGCVRLIQLKPVLRQRWSLAKMAPNRVCWRLLAVCTAVGYCALVAPPALANGGGSLSSLAGWVYLDSNRNLSLDTTDWAIPGATLELYRGTDLTPLMTTVSDMYGRYVFDGIPGGFEYSIVLTCCSVQPGGNTVGSLLDLNTGNPIVPAGQTYPDISQRDRIIGISIPATGAVGDNYNFGQFIYPLELVSKRMLLSTSQKFNHAPEPGTAVLLAVAGLVLVGGALRRVRPWR